MFFYLTFKNCHLHRIPSCLSFFYLFGTLKLPYLSLYSQLFVGQFHRIIAKFKSTTSHSSRPHKHHTMYFVLTLFTICSWSHNVTCIKRTCLYLITCFLSNNANVRGPPPNPNRLEEPLKEHNSPYPLPAITLPTPSQFPTHPKTAAANVSGNPQQHHPPHPPAKKKNKKKTTKNKRNCARKSCSCSTSLGLLDYLKFQNMNIISYKRI